MAAISILCCKTLEGAEASSVPYAQIEAIERSRGAGDGVIAQALRGPDRALARRAALALGRTKRPENAPLLRAQLTSSDSGLRALTVFSLGLIGLPEDLKSVEPLVTRDASSAVRYAAVDAAGRIVYANASLATPAIARPLIAAMTHDRDAAVRAHAAANLDVFGKCAAASEIARQIEAAFSSERSVDVRWHEVWVLYRGFSGSVDPRFLASQLQSPDELVRIEALRAVGKRKDAGAEHFVRPLVADSSWRVQLQARETLLALAGEPATQHLTSFPPALNLPEIPAPAGTAELVTLPPIATPVPSKNVTPSPAPSPGPSAPAPADLSNGPPLDPTSAESLNGPMPGRHPRVELHTTRGDIVVRLYPEWAPVAVANFLLLTKEGYFTNNRWFRIVPDFVHQTGDATNDADHDSGYTIGAEENPVEQRTGIIAMGLNYDRGHAVRDSAGTQFYITDSPQLHLDRDFSVFGEVERGFDVLANLLESDRIVTAERTSDD